MKLDCRDKLTLEDGSTCAFMNHSAGWDSIRLCMFDLYAPSGTLIVKCRVMGKLFRYLSFTNAEGQELATIRFKWALPVLHLPDGSEIELNFFRIWVLISCRKHRWNCLVQQSTAQTVFSPSATILKPINKGL